MLTRGHDHQLRGKTVRGSVLPGRGGGGGGSKRWLNTGRHLLTVALSSSLHWFPVKCIAETRRSAPKRHKHELIFEGIEGRILVRDTIDARTCRDAGSRKCVVSVVIVVCYFCRNRRGERSTYQRAFQDDGDDNDVKPTRPSWAERDPGGGSTPFPTSSDPDPRPKSLILERDLRLSRHDLKNHGNLRTWSPISMLGSGQGMIGRVMDRGNITRTYDYDNFNNQWSLVQIFEGKAKLARRLNSHFEFPTTGILFRVSVSFFFFFSSPKTRLKLKTWYRGKKKRDSKRLRNVRIIRFASVSDEGNR